MEKHQIEKQKNQVHILIIYDIEDDKKRAKFAKYLLSYGYRVQKSAFEAIITNMQYETMQKQIPYKIDETVDSVRIYKISENTQIVLYGKNKKISSQEYIIL